MQTLWDHRYAQRTLQMKSSAIRELLKFAEMPDVISFAGGMPAPEVFPIKEFRDACMKVLSENGAACLQYGSTDGYMPLREMIARHSARYGITVNVVSPGFVETERAKLIPMGKEELSKQIPLGRFASPKEIAEVVVFLASAQAAYITGSVIEINGGKIGYHIP